jgi:Na+/melibiose symporter-like transporter
MFEVKKKYVPYIIGIPNMGVGLLWAMNMVLIPMLAATVTQSNSKLAILVSMGAFTGIFVQYIAGLLSDRSHFKMGRRKPFILGGAFFAAIFICLMPMASNYTLLFIFSFMFYFSLNFYQGPYY